MLIVWERMGLTEVLRKIGGNVDRIADTEEIRRAKKEVLEVSEREQARSDIYAFRMMIGRAAE